MPIPRNQLAKNRNKHSKNPAAKDISKKISELDTICERHKIGKLTFKSCKLSTVDGIVTFIDYEEIKGNMRASTMVIKVNSMTEQPNVVYDIVQLKKDKNERDQKKQQEGIEKAKPEIERLKKAMANTDAIDGSDQHKKLLEKLVNEDNVTAELNDKIDVEVESTTEEKKDSTNEPTEPAIEELSVDGPTEIIKEEPTDTLKEINGSGQSDAKKAKRKKLAKVKREKALKQMNDILMQKANKKGEGNKYHRNFMKDLRSKFILEQKDKFKYVEAKAETTDMVIDNARIYQITMPSKTTNVYLLIVGDLELKSKLLRQIDPNYKSEQVFDDHSEFLERIKAKENAKVKESAEDLIDEEFDELEELGIFDEDEKAESPQLAPVEIVNSLLNPELIRLKEESK